jgi:hypothetical protein
MKFKPITLVVIGILLGSTITLAVTRPATEQVEILACANKSTGKTRLTISGACNFETETESAVTDLWGLQPTTSTSTQPRALKKYVVDANGQNLGELVTREGLNLFWTMYKGGLFSLDNSGGIGGTVSSWDPPIYSDSKCRNPYLGYWQNENKSSTRAVVEIAPLGSPSKPLEKRAFQATGNPIATPKTVFYFVTPEQSKIYNSRLNSSVIAPEIVPWLEVPGCVRITSNEANKYGFGGSTPRQVLRSIPAPTPVFTGPLSIIEK